MVDLQKCPGVSASKRRLREWNGKKRGGEVKKNNIEGNMGCKEWVEGQQ